MASKSALTKSFGDRRSFFKKDFYFVGSLEVPSSTPAPKKILPKKIPPVLWGIL
jgi:hypothetical protein